MAVEIRIEGLNPEHWDEVRGIYLDGIATGLATFETTAPTWEEWDASHVRFARIVAVAGQASSGILGWAALSPVSQRAVYKGVTEVRYQSSTRRQFGCNNRIERLDCFFLNRPFETSAQKGTPKAGKS
ncbi:MAG: GNAT family N-acetyltransferase [Pyrinomonadaceae bacterium]